MDNSKEIYKQWIDRETYQKAFNLLKESSYSEKEFNHYPKMVVSAVYDKQSRELKDLEREVLDFEDVELTHSLTDGFSDKGRLDYIKIQLERGGKTVYEVRHPAEMFAKIYRKKR